MEQIIYFNSYNQGIIELTPSEISKAMYKEASRPGGYDYIDPQTGLSFQLVGTTRAFVADPESPIVSQILTAQWQIIYDATFSGVGKLKFVASGLDNTVSTNWKTINDVLQSYNWSGNLPVKTLSQVYMGVFDISTSLYVVGTLFTPSQPYLRLYLQSAAAVTVASNADSRVAYNTVDDQVGVEEADDAKLVPVLTGTNTGQVRLKAAGLYLVEANVGVSVTSATLARLSVRLNGSLLKLVSYNIPANGGEDTNTVATLRVKRSDLSNVTFPDEAVLEITLNNVSSAAATITTANESTSLTVTFLG